MSRAERSARQVWGAPLLLAASSVAGLVLALLGDGIWDAASWLALGLPVTVMAWCAWGPPRPAPAGKTGRGTGRAGAARAGMPGRR